MGGDDDLMPCSTSQRARWSEGLEANDHDLPVCAGADHGGR